MGFLGNSAGKESACNAGDMGLVPWVRKIPWRRAWQPTPVFLPGESAWTEEPGMLQSMGSQRVGYNWVTKHSTSSNTAILTEDTKLLFTDVSVIYWCVQTTPRLSGLGQQSFHCSKFCRLWWLLPFSTPSPNLPLCMSLSLAFPCDLSNRWTRFLQDGCELSKTWK